MKRTLRQATGTWLCAVLLFGLLPTGLWGAPSPASAATNFTNVSVNTATPAMYDKLEIVFDLSTTYTNPFNPDEVDVRAYFLTPSGQTEVVPGFYNKDSSPKWAVRYAPRQMGSHSVYIRVSDAGGQGQSGTLQFTAGAPGANRGFMGVSGSRFVDSYGKQLTLLGSNYAWRANQILDEMPLYKANNMNIMRVWYTTWWNNYAPEWGPVTTTQNGITMVYDGIGRYHLDNQARVDELMDTAAANNIYIMFTMNSFGDFWYDWAKHAYNTANGGPSTWTENNTDFWTNPTAISYQKKLLRYMFARWGYSRGFGMLEYWNESDNRVDTSAANRASWHSEMDGYWKSWDFYGRPTTTSFAWKDNQQHNHPTWETLPMLDATNFHRYNGTAGVLDVWESELKRFITQFGGRPAFVGEVGRTHGDNSSDPHLPRFMHDGLWGPIFRAGAAGGNLWWTFENGFNIPASFKNIYKVIADFIQPEEQYLIHMPHQDYGQQTNATKVGGYRNADRVLLWINDTQAPHTTSNPRTVSGMSFTVQGMNQGTYQVLYYNTVTGATAGTDTVSVGAGGQLVLSAIPAFQRDIAVKAVRQGSETPDTLAPTAPTGLQWTDKTATTVQLSWNPSNDNVGVTGYDVYRGSTWAGSTSGATSFLATGLSANTAYTFTVRAKDLAGNISGPSNSVTVTTDAPDTQAPTSPAGLTSPAKTDKTVDLVWQASTDNIGVTAYDIYRGSTLAGTVNGTSTAYTVGGLSASTTYSFTVRARDAAGNISIPSSALSVTTLPPMAPNLLANPGFEQIDSGGMASSWTCAQPYYCSRDTSVKRSGSASLRVQGTAGAWFGVYQDVVVTPGQAYTLDGFVSIPASTKTDVYVRYRNASGSVLATHTAAAFSATQTTSGFVPISGTFTAPAGTASARVEFYFTGLNGTVYADDFYFSAAGSAAPDTQVPTTPTGLASPSKTSTTVNLTWTASTDNVGVTGYDVYRGSTLAGSTTGATSYQATGLSPSTAYSFTVRARDAAGNVSAPSSALSVTTNAAPDTQAPTTPTGLASPSKTSTTVSLTWTASTDNVGVTGYDVYRGSTLAGSTTGATSYQATGLSPSTAYSFTVRARDAAGNVSSPSSALSVTTDAPPSINLLANPGFETDNGAGKPAVWTVEQPYYAFRDTSVKRSGDASMRIEGSSGPWFGWSQEVSGAAGQSYALSGYVNIAANTTTVLRVRLQFLDAANAVLADHTAATYNANATTSGFEQVGGTYTAPANTAKVRVYTHLTSMRGTFYFDDFSLMAN